MSDFQKEILANPVLSHSLKEMLAGFAVPHVTICGLKYGKHPFDTKHKYKVNEIEKFDQAHEINGVTCGKIYSFLGTYCFNYEIQYTVEDLIACNYELLFRSRTEYPMHLSNFYEPIEEKYGKKNQIRLNYSFDIIKIETELDTRIVEISLEDNKFFSKESWNSKREVSIDDMILLVPISINKGVWQFKQIPLKLLRDQYFTELCKLEKASLLQDCIIKNRDIVLTSIRQSLDVYQNNLDNFGTIKLPVSIIHLQIANEVLKIYPIYFCHLIDKIGILYDETIIEDSFRQVSNASEEIKLNIIKHESFNQLTLKTVKLFFNHVYRSTLPNVVELCGLGDELKDQLKCLMILANYLGIKYYNHFYQELYNSI